MSNEVFARKAKTQEGVESVLNRRLPARLLRVKAPVDAFNVAINVLPDGLGRLKFLVDSARHAPININLRGRGIANM